MKVESSPYAEVKTNIEESPKKSFFFSRHKFFCAGFQQVDVFVSVCVCVSTTWCKTMFSHENLFVFSEFSVGFLLSFVHFQFRQTNNIHRAMGANCNEIRNPHPHTKTMNQNEGEAFGFSWVQSVVRPHPPRENVLFSLFFVSSSGASFSGCFYSWNVFLCTRNLSRREVQLHAMCTRHLCAYRMHVKCFAWFSLFLWQMLLFCLVLMVRQYPGAALCSKCPQQIESEMNINVGVAVFHEEDKCFHHIFCIETGNSRVPRSDMRPTRHRVLSIQSKINRHINWIACCVSSYIKCHKFTFISFPRHPIVAHSPLPYSWTALNQIYGFEQHTKLFENINNKKANENDIRTSSWCHKWNNMG